MEKEDTVPMTLKNLLNSSVSIHGEDLLDKQKFSIYLKNLTEEIKSPSLLVTASQFSKRYSHSLLIRTLFEMTVNKRKIETSLENIFIEPTNDQYLLKVQFKNLTDINRIYDADSLLRDAILVDLFKNNITKVWNVLSKLSGLPLQILWENTAIYFFWLYEKHLIDEGIEQKRINEDFSYILSSSEEIFGTSNHPFLPFYSTKNDGEVRRRKTCCLRYKLLEGNLSCPNQTKK